VGSIDWNEVVKALNDIDYKGEFTLEADSFLGSYNAENVFEGVQALAASAKKLVEMFENG
jgi:sugar phosphate isomerase/epimerase